MTVRSACLARRELDSLDFDMLNQFGGAKHGREQSFPLDYAWHSQFSR